MTAKLIAMRRLKVAYKFRPVDYGYGYRRVPVINLSGNWL